jgi:hypothetical protein
MERLTKVMSCPNGTKIYDISNKLFGLNISRADKTRMILEKLAEYEDLAEQGRLVILPCKVGETYYSIEVNTKSCEECDFFQKGYYCDDFCENKIVTDEDDDTLINPQYSDKVFCKKHFYEINKCFFDNVDEIFNLRECFGKTVFLTKPEAEAKLKELRGGENESSN